MFIDLNIKIKARQLLKENIRAYFHNLKLSKNFLVKTQKALTIKDKINKLDFSKT